jgi:predicted site-specific integrase-resolvase
MKEIVLKYLNDNYKFTLSTYVSYKLRERLSNDDVSLKEVLTQLDTIFSLTPDELRDFFELWSDIKSIEINNLVVEMQDKIYQLTGKTINVTPEQMNGMIDVVNVREEPDDLIRMLLGTTVTH